MVTAETIALDFARGAASLTLERSDRREALVAMAACAELGGLTVCLSSAAHVASFLASRMAADLALVDACLSADDLSSLEGLCGAVLVVMPERVLH